MNERYFHPQIFRYLMSDCLLWNISTWGKTRLFC